MCEREKEKEIEKVCGDMASVFPVYDAAWGPSVRWYSSFYLNNNMHHREAFLKGEMVRNPGLVEWLKSKLARRAKIKRLIYQQAMRNRKNLENIDGVPDETLTAFLHIPPLPPQLEAAKLVFHHTARNAQVFCIYLLFIFICFVNLLTC